MNKDRFKEELEKLSIVLNEEQTEKLEKYYQMLITYNAHTNLTAITNKEDVYLKHFYDSLCLVKIIDLNESIKVCDIGTGAGFPGLVLKIVFPNLDVTLVDSTRKKTIFLEQVIETLDLKKIRVITERIEDFSKNNEEVFDLVVARALAKLNVLLELSAKMIKIKGSFIAMKSEATEELKSTTNASRILKMKKHGIIKYELPIEESVRTLIKFIKTDKTNKEYPRLFTKIKNNPL